MNYYAAAIEVITSERNDWREIVTKIAKRHPKIVVEAAKGTWEKEAKELMDGGYKIEAIKLCRNATGMSLKDAKEAVERLAA